MSQQLIQIQNPPPQNLVYDGLKRLFDILAGIVLLVLFSLPLLVIAIAIRCTSEGSILYRQKRVGKNNRNFNVYKFRTMYTDADQQGPLITASDDARITPLGRFLRNNKLDELPQLFNVIRGDMSLVGPRPQVPKFVDEFRPEHRAIVLAVRPGITGPTQLKFRAEEKMLAGQRDRERYYIETLLPIKCEMDVAYVQQRSLLQDARILWDTAMIVTGGMLLRLRRKQDINPTEAVVRDPYREDKEAAADRRAVG